MLWRTGTIRFPQTVLNRINEVEKKGFKPVGDEVRQQLERFKFWQGLQGCCTWSGTRTNLALRSL